MKTIFLGSVFLAVATAVVASPCSAQVKVYTNEAAFDAAITGATIYTPILNAFGASSYMLGPVMITAPLLDTYTGDYGPGVRSLGAFLSPVTYRSNTSALGLNLGYYIGPQTATYTIDGVSGTITVPDNAANPNNVFIGFTDTAPITVVFTTDSAEFDTLRAVTGFAAPAPEASSWLMMIVGFGVAGAVFRRRKQVGKTKVYAA